MVDTYARRSESGLKLNRLTGAASVKGSPGKLYWITVRGSADGWVVALSDGTASGTVIWDVGDNTKRGSHINLDPPIPFETGIYLETLTNCTAATFGYI